MHEHNTHYGQFNAEVEGCKAFARERRTGDRAYNPYTPNTPEHDSWDAGYQRALDESRTC